MPISRYQIRNVYSLADPELYKAADKDDPEALLEGVAMAGLVGVLRQLGDLADFAAEIFHNLHEEVTATAARGHGLQERVQQLELEIPSIERAFLSQTCHSAFFLNSGIDWHPNKKTSQNHITTGDLPRFVMDFYEECRGPPRLFLLDKFDVGGAGACLKRYSDPSFYKVEVSSYENESTQNQRDKKICKIKKKGSQGKEGGTPEISPTSRVKLHQLFLEDRVQNGTTEPTRLVKLKNRPNKSPFDSETGESYMNKLLNTPSESKIVHPVHIRPSIVPVPFSTSNQSEPEIFKDTIISPSNSTTQSRSPSVSSTDRRNLVAGKVIGRQVSSPTSSTSSEVDEKQINEEIGTNGVQNGDDVASEIENYVDALASMESEVETEGRKGNNSSNSAEIAAIVGTTEIPLHSRVSTEKIPGTHACIDVNQGLRLEEGKDDENLGNEDFLSPAGSLFSLKFYLNCEGELDNEETNEGSSPVIHVPNILETSDRISEDNQSTGSVRSRCSSSHAVISRVDEQQPFGVSLEEHNFVVEGASDSRDTYSLPENQLKEIGDDDDVLHISDSAKPEDSYFSQDEKGSKRSEIETLTDAVSDLDDVHRSGGLKERETGLGNSEIKVGGDAMSVPDDVDKNDDNALSTLEDDTQLEGREEDFVVSEIEKIAAVLLAADVNKNDNEDSKESDEKEEVDQLLVISQDSDSAPYDDSSRKPLLDSIPNTSLVVSDDDDNSSFCQDQTHSFLAKPDKKGQQAAVLHDLENHESESKSMTQGDDIDTSEATQLSHVENKVDPQLLLASGAHETHLDTHSVNLLSQSVLQEDLQEKPVSVSVPDKPPTFELPLMNGHEVKNVDQVNHQFHSDPYEVNLPSQSEEDPQEKPTIVSVSESVTSHGTDPFDQVKHQSHSDPDPVSLTTKSILHEKIPEGKPMTKSVPVPDKPPTLELPQASSHDTNLFDQVKHQSPPVFPVFNILPETPPVKLEDAPPLPPLPPMQWRTRKLQSPSLTPTNGGQHSDHNFPPIFQSKPNDVAGPTPLFDEIKNPETENEKLKNEGSLETEDHDKSSEEKFKENLVPQAAVETDSAKSSSANLIPQNDEMLSGVRPLKIQRPCSPLIDAVAAHDKTKLRKVSDRATSQIPKGQENDKLLEQIRTKSYNLKPAVKTRPIVHGPTTNVRLAAILEKANAIRHAFAGSDDDDDDSDSWSDS